MQKHATDCKEFDSQPSPTSSATAEAMTPTSQESPKNNMWPWVIGGILGVPVVGGVATWFFTSRKY